MEYSSRSLNKFKENLRQLGDPDVDTTDTYLVRRLTREIEERGYTIDEIGDPEFASHAREVANLKPRAYKGAIDEFGRGISSGLEGMKGTAKAGIGLAAGALGFDEVEDDLMSSARLNFEKAIKEGPRSERDITKVNPFAEGGSWSSLGRWAAGMAGEVAPQALELVGSMVIGAGVGGVAAQAAKQGIKKKIKDEIKEGVDLDERLRKEMRKKFSSGAKWGAGVSTAGSSITQNSGEVYADLYNSSNGFTEPEYIMEDGERVKNPNYVDAKDARMMSILAGGVSGALESAIPLTLIGRLSQKIGMGEARTQVGKMINSMPAGVVFAGTAGVEGATEAGQELVNWAAAKIARGEDLDLTQQDINQLINAGAMGVMGGTVLGGGVELTRKALSSEDSAPDIDISDIPEQEDEGVIEPTYESDLSTGDYVIRPATGEVGRVMENLGGGKLKVVNADGEVILTEGGSEEQDATRWNLDPDLKLDLEKDDLAKLPTVSLKRIEQFATGDYAKRVEEVLKERGEEIARTELVEEEVKTFLTLPSIPKGFVRIIHQTSESLIEKIKSEGLQWKFNLGNTAHVISSMDQLDSYVDDQGNLKDFTGGGSTMNVAVMDIPQDVYDRAARPKRYANPDGTFEVEGTIDPKYFVAKVSGKNVLASETKEPVKIKENLVVRKEGKEEVLEGKYEIKEDDDDISYEFTPQPDLTDSRKLAIKEAIEEKLKAVAEKKKKSFKGIHTWIDSLTDKQMVKEHEARKGSAKIELAKRLKSKGYIVNDELIPSRKDFADVETNREKYYQLLDEIENEDIPTSGKAYNNLKKNDKLRGFLNKHHSKHFDSDGNLLPNKIDRELSRDELKEEQEKRRLANEQWLKTNKAEGVFKYERGNWLITKVFSEGTVAIQKIKDGKPVASETKVIGVRNLGERNPDYKVNKIGEVFIDSTSNIRKYIFGKRAGKYDTLDNEGVVIAQTTRDEKPTPSQVKRDREELDIDLEAEQQAEEEKRLKAIRKIVGKDVKIGPIVNNRFNVDTKIGGLTIRRSYKWEPVSETLQGSRPQPVIAAGWTGPIPYFQTSEEVQKDFPSLNPEGFYIRGFRDTDGSIRLFEDRQTKPIYTESKKSKTYTNKIPLINPEGGFSWKTVYNQWTGEKKSVASPSSSSEPILDNYSEDFGDAIIKYQPAKGETIKDAIGDKFDTQTKDNRGGRTLGVVFQDKESGEVFVRTAQAVKDGIKVDGLISQKAYNPRAQKSRARIVDSEFDEKYSVIGYFEKASRKSKADTWITGAKKRFNFEDQASFKAAKDKISKLPEDHPFTRYKDGDTDEEIVDENGDYNPLLSAYNSDFHNDVRVADILAAFGLTDEARDAGTGGARFAALVKYLEETKNIPVRDNRKVSLTREEQQAVISYENDLVQESESDKSESDSEDSEDSQDSVGEGLGDILRDSGLNPDELDLDILNQVRIDKKFEEDEGIPKVFLSVLVRTQTKIEGLVGAIQRLEPTDLLKDFINYTQKVRPENLDWNVDNFIQNLASEFTTDNPNLSNLTKLLEFNLQYEQLSQAERTADLDSSIEGEMGYTNEEVIGSNDLSDSRVDEDSKRMPPKPKPLIERFPQEQREGVLQRNAQTIVGFLQGSEQNTDIRATHMLERALGLATGKVKDALRRLQGHPLLDDIQVVFHDQQSYMGIMPDGSRKDTHVFGFFSGDRIHMGDIFTSPLDSDADPMEKLLMVLTEELGHAVLHKTISMAQDARDGKPLGNKHKLTKSALKKIGENSKRIYEHLVREAKGEFVHGLQNEQEMWANFLYNEDFRNFIKNTNPPSFLESVLQWMKRTINRIFFGEYDSTMEKVMDEQLELFIQVSADERILRPAFPIDDQAYFEAIGRGDMDEVARMVERAAVLAGFDPRVVYHGVGKGFLEDNKFKKDKLGSNTGAPSANLGFFFAGSPETSETYLRGRAIKIKEGQKYYQQIKQVTKNMLNEMRQVMGEAEWKEWGDFYMASSGVPYLLSDSEYAEFSNEQVNISLKELRKYGQQIADNYTAVFEVSAETPEVSDAISSGEGIEPNLLSLLRALEEDDWLGFDYPLQAINAMLYEEEFVGAFEISSQLKSAIAKYVEVIDPNKKGQYDAQGNFVRANIDPYSPSGRYDSIRKGIFNLNDSDFEETNFGYAVSNLQMLKSFLDQHKQKNLNDPTVVLKNASPEIKEQYTQVIAREKIREQQKKVDALHSSRRKDSRTARDIKQRQKFRAELGQEFDSAEAERLESIIRDVEPSSEKITLERKKLHEMKLESGDVEYLIQAIMHLRGELSVPDTKQAGYDPKTGYTVGGIYPVYLKYNNPKTYLDGGELNRNVHYSEAIKESRSVSPNHDTITLSKAQILERMQQISSDEEWMRASEADENSEYYDGEDSFLIRLKYEKNVLTNLIKSGSLPDAVTFFVHKSGPINDKESDLNVPMQYIAGLAKDSDQHDAVIIQETYDGGGKDDIFVVFEPNQIKSADPIAYDENGEIIPLSKRFDTATDNIYTNEEVVGEPAGASKVAQKASIVSSTYETVLAGINRFESAFAKAISKISPEMQDKDHVKNAIKEHTKIPKNIKIKGQKDVAVLPRDLKQVVSEKMSFVETRKVVGDQPVQTNVDRRIGDFGQPALRDQARVYAHNILSGYLQKAHDAKDDLTKTIEENQKIIEDNKEKLSKLTSKTTIFNQVQVKSELARRAGTMLKGRNMNATYQRLLAINPEADLPTADYKIDEDKLFDTLVGLTELNYDVETKDFSYLVNNLDITASDIGFNGSDEFAKAIVARLVGSDGYKDSKVAFSLRVRASRDALLTAQEDEWKKVKQAAVGDYTSVDADGVFAEEIKTIKEIRKESDKATQTIDKAKDNTKIADVQIETYEEELSSLNEQLGMHKPVELYEGVAIKTLALSQDGEIIEEEDVFQVVSPESAEGKKLLRKAGETLKIIRSDKFKEKYGSTPSALRYYKEMAQKLSEAFTPDIMNHAHLGFKLSALQSFQRVFAKAGRFGVEMSKVLNGFTRDNKEYQKRFYAQGLRTARAHRRLGKELGGMEMSKYLTTFYKKTIGWFESRPEIQNYEDGARKLWNQLKDEKFMGLNYSSPNGYKAFLKMLIEVDMSRKMVRGVANQWGLSIEDEGLVTKDMVTGNLNSIYRREIEKGALTVARSADMDVVEQAMDFRDGKAQIDVFKAMLESLEDKGEEADAETSAIAVLSKSGISANVENFFLNPVLTSLDARTTGLFVPQGEDKKVLVAPEVVKDAWESSEGANAGARLANMIRIINPSGDFEATAKVVLKHLVAKASAVEKLYDATAQANSDKNLLKIQYGKKVDSSLHNRELSMVLPSDFFQYSSYSEIEMPMELNKMAHAKHLGRNGEVISKAYEMLDEDYEKTRQDYNNLMRALGKKPLGNDEFPDGAILKTIRGTSKAKIKKVMSMDKFKDLEVKVNSYVEAIRAWKKFNEFMSGQESWMRDTTTGMDFLKFVAFGNVNNIRSALMNLGSIPDINRKLGLSGDVVFRTTLGSAFGTAQEILGGYLERWGADFRLGNFQPFAMNDYQRVISEIFNDPLADDAEGVTGMMGYKGELNKSQRAMRSIRAWIEKNKGGRGKKANRKFTALSTRSFLPFLGSPFGTLSQAITRSLANNYAKHLHRRVQNAAKVLDVMNIDPFDTNIELTAEQMGFADTTLDQWIFGKKQGVEWLNTRLLSEGQSLTKLAQDYRRRKLDNEKANILTDEGVKMAVNLVMSDVVYEGLSGKPRQTSSGVAMAASPLLNWSLSALSHGQEAMTDQRGQIAMKQAFRYLLVYGGGFALPMGILITLMTDWFDEEILGTPSSLRKVPPIAATPVIGTFAAMADPRFDWNNYIERTTRVSGMFGLGQEILGATLGTDDTRYRRDITNRIMLVNMLDNVRKTSSTLVKTGELDYQNIIRPVMYTMGMGGALQLSQLATSAVPALADPVYVGDDPVNINPFAEEQQVKKMIGLKNLLVSHAQAIDVELKPVVGEYSPTNISLQIKKMQRSAYSNDTEGFLSAYRAALLASTKPDPHADVVAKFKQKTLHTAVTKLSMSDQDMEAVLSIMDEDDRKAIRDAQQAHEYYLNLIGGTPAKSRKTTTQFSESLRLMSL
jgi:hypothetical protein